MRWDMTPWCSALGAAAPSGNDPQRTAQSFRLILEEAFPTTFDTVVFAVTDWSPQRTTLGPFREVFSA